MKSLAITFFTAIAIIGMAIFFDAVSEKVAFTDATALVGKTTVTRDALGRVTSEVTSAINGKEWQESTMRQISYYDNKTVAVNYQKADGTWIATTKVITETINDMPVSLAYFMASPDGDWVEIAQQQTDDLASNDVVDDLVFDVDGNLVMKATYVYRNGQKVGLAKEEYGFDDNSQRTRVFYAWNGDCWDATVASKEVAE